MRRAAIKPPSVQKPAAGIAGATYEGVIASPISPDASDSDSDASNSDLPAKKPPPAPQPMPTPTTPSAELSLALSVSRPKARPHPPMELQATELDASCEAEDIPMTPAPQGSTAHDQPPPPQPTAPQESPQPPPSDVASIPNLWCEDAAMTAALFISAFSQEPEPETEGTAETEGALASEAGPSKPAPSTGAKPEPTPVREARGEHL